MGSTHQQEYNNSYSELSKTVEIRLYELKQIDNTLRMAINLFNSMDKKEQSCFDRDLLKSKEYTEKLLTVSLPE